MNVKNSGDLMLELGYTVRAGVGDLHGEHVDGNEINSINSRVLEILEVMRIEAHRPTYTEAITIAADLIGPDIIEGADTNDEYVRGICELIGDIWGKPGLELGIRKAEVARDLGIELT